MSHFSQPPSYEQVATADHELEETISLSSDSTEVQKKEDDGKEGSKDDFVLVDVKEKSKHDSVLIDKKRHVVESIETDRKSSTTSRQRDRWRCLPTGYGWLWEILAMNLAIFCQIAVVTILIYMNGKPLTHWESKISLNAIISVFVTISKSALLVPVTTCVSQLKWRHFGNKSHMLKEMDIFDRSSRGPLGALELLTYINLRAPVASFGAGIILLALAIDPFTQQILEFPVKTVPASVGNASAAIQAAFQVSNVYNWSAGVDTAGGLADFKMQGAFVAGLTGYNPVSEVTCGSSNCNWPDIYFSLGVVSSCTNVTSTTIRTCKPLTEETSNHRSYTCNLTTPGGGFLTASGYHFVDFDVLTGTNVTSVWQTASHVSSASPSSNNDGTYAADFFTFATFRNPSADSYTTNDAPGEVFECTLSWSGYIYENISVVSNDFNIGTRQPLPLTPTGNDNSSGYILTNPLLKSKYPGQEPVFSVDPQSEWSLQDSLKSVFTGSYGLPAGIIPRYGQGTTGSLFAAEALYNADIVDTGTAIAFAMTERVRSATNATSAVGVAHELNVFVHVRWAWLILPLTLVFASQGFLIASIMLGSRGNTPLWKLSSLPLLFHSLKPWNEEEHVVRSARQMDRVAEVTRVQLLGDRELEFHVT